jgi:hypothetical protein
VGLGLRPVFAGVFAKSWWLNVVFCVAERGGMCGERGVVAPHILGAKNTPGFWDLFS